MHEDDVREIEVIDEPGQPPAAAPEAEGTTSALSPAQKAAATRKAKRDQVGNICELAVRIATLTARVRLLTDRCVLATRARELAKEELVATLEEYTKRLRAPEEVNGQC